MCYKKGPEGDNLMTGRACIITFMLILTLGSVSCTKLSIYGTLIGVVVRDGTDAPIPDPVLIISPIAPTLGEATQIYSGDDLGRFTIVLPHGSYKVKIGLKEEGPFAKFTDPVPVFGNGTTIRNFAIAQDFQ
jgi:hypothetical protein